MGVRPNIGAQFNVAELDSETNASMRGARMPSSALFSDNLIYFSVLYRELDYAKAARAIPMTYQGLKKAIKSLERSLGATLFVRDKAGLIVPTKEADILFETVCAWTRQAGSLEKELRAVQGETYVLDIGVSDGAKAFFGSKVFDNFERSHPGLRVATHEAPDRLVDSMLASGEVNIALTVGPFDAAFDTRWLANAPFVAWVGKGHVLAEREKLEVGDLAGQTVVFRDSRAKCVDNALALLGRAGVEPSNIVLKSELFSVLMAALMGEGIGIGIGFDVISTAIGNHTDLVQIPIQGFVEWELGLSCREARELDTAERLLAGYMLRRASGLVGRPVMR